jgi:ABC-type antimicrobial peptide transport system permease subunit
MQIHRILFVQASIMAIAGSLLGLVLVAAIQAGFASPRVPILIPWWLSLGSCALVLTICLVSSLLPYARIRKVDPLIVLQG